MANDDNNHEKIALIQDVCGGVSKERALQLLEAGSGSLERAIAIHLGGGGGSSTSAATLHCHDDDDTHNNAVSVGDNNNDNDDDDDDVIVVDDYSSNKKMKKPIDTISSQSMTKKRKTFVSSEASPPAAGNEKNTEKKYSPQKQTKLSTFFNGGYTPQKTSPSLRNEGTKKEKAVDSQSSRTKKYNIFTSSTTSDKNKPNSIASTTNNGTSKLEDETKRMKNTSVGHKNLTERYTDDPRLHYQALADAFSEMVGTTKRLAKINSLKNVIRDIVEAVGGINTGSNTNTENSSNGDEGVDSNNNRFLQKQRSNDSEVLYRALNLMLPGAIKLNVSGSAVSKAICTVTGVSASRLRDAYRRTGDLGDAAAEFVRNQTLLVQPKPLTILSVYDVLQQISSQEGKGSQSMRQSLIVKLLRSCRHSEMRFLVRTLLNNMRLGANTRTVIQALASVFVEQESKLSGEPDEMKNNDMVAKAIKAVQATFDICPRLDKITQALLYGGINHMEATCVLEVGTPVNPMLANAAHSFDEIAKMMNSNGDGTTQYEAVAEWKYDGVRCQAHFDNKNGAVTLFSRHMLDNTDQYPDAVRSLLNARNPINVKSFIVDCEIVAVEISESKSSKGSKNNFRLLPFQDLATRSGSTKVANVLDTKGSNHVQIRLYAFDLMYLNGESLINQPLRKRQQKLNQSFRETDSFGFASSITLSHFDEGILSKTLERSVSEGAEGLMVKLTGKKKIESDLEQLQKVGKNNEELTCHYESGTRSQTWLKVKKDYVSGFADTIDVVPIGAWYGNGRKAQKGFLSPILLAVYDEDEDVYRSISRCMSFSDKMYEAMRDFYLFGKPYPKDVGIESVIPSIAVEENKFHDKSNEDSGGEGDDEVSGSSGLDVNDEDDEDESKTDERVNCYSSKPAALFVTNESPPIWFKPSEVFEVSFADLSLSRTHTAASGLVDEDKTRGVALRFPRFCRRRPDKSIEQATTTEQIATMFSKQSKQGRGVK